ncbi:MAG: hypothetical protein SWO11_17940 [Thermodesulfobacteriota bacterium]|nr:hypothetical protein [Thermodesulfobacteriota bacterium]
MKCLECGFEAAKEEFRYLYNARIDASISMRQCPKCQAWLSCDEMKEELGETVKPGQAPWGKSAGIEGIIEE